jgi:hypothetical protein
VDENNIGEIVLGCAIKAPIALGPGLLENAYDWRTLTKRVSLMNLRKRV